MSLVSIILLFFAIFVAPIEYCGTILIAAGLFAIASKL